MKTHSSSHFNIYIFILNIILTIPFWDHFTLPENCPPTPPLNQHFALSEKEVLMLA